MTTNNLRPPRRRRRRSVWLASVRPSDVVFDATGGEYGNVQWTGMATGWEERERRAEAEEVRRRWTGGWYDGRLECVPPDEDDDDDEDMFFDAVAVGGGVGVGGEFEENRRLGNPSLSVVAEESWHSAHSCVGSASDGDGEGSAGSGGAQQAQAQAFLAPGTGSNDEGTSGSDWESCKDDDDDDDDGHSDDDEQSVQSVQSVQSAESGGSMPVQRAVLSNQNNAKLTSMGEHIKNTNVFALERMNDKTVAAIFIAYYVVFVALALYGFIWMWMKEETVEQLAVVPSGTNVTGSDYVCYYPNMYQVMPLIAGPPNEAETPGGSTTPVPVPCAADPANAITVDEAVLLANTVIVSDGINVTDWAGYGALPGTPPFFALNNVTDGSFIINASSLDYGANPELHARWDDMSAAVWYGHSDGLPPSGSGIIAATLRLNFVRTDGRSWPPDTATNFPLPVTAHLYACVRGANCTNVGDYRSQLLQPHDESIYFNPVQTLSPDGGTFVLTLTFPNSLLDHQAVQSYGWRLVLHGDPNAVVSSCLRGENCIVQTSMENAKSRYEVVVIIDTVVLVCYFFFFAWWLITLLWSLGLPNRWTVEQQWLLVMGIGTSLYNNAYSVALSLDSAFNEVTYVFDEYQWAASLMITQFGVVLAIFALAVFADGPRRYVSNAISFYYCKLSFCFVWYMSFFIGVLWKYPMFFHRDQPGTESVIGGLGFVTTPRTLPYYDKVVVSVSALVFATCIGIAYLYYIIRVVITYRVLSKLPYNMTRPVQISFRLYVWATFIWMAAEWFIFIASSLNGIYHGLSYQQENVSGIDRLILGLDRMRVFSKHRNFATVLFSAICTSIFQALLSPPSALGPVQAEKTHHESEKDAASEAKLNKAKERLGFQVQKNIIILERARLLCVASREAYLPFDKDELVERKFDDVECGLVDDTRAGNANANGNTSTKIHMGEVHDAVPRASAGKSSLADSFIPFGYDESTPVRLAGAPSGVGGPSPPGSTFGLGCRVVAHLSEPASCDMHDTRAILLRHVPSGDLILSFRGTLTLKQVKTDLMGAKIKVSLDTFLAVISKRERERRDQEGIVPEVVEELLLTGRLTKAHLLDLLHCDSDDELPDYLRSATKSSLEQKGICGIHFGFWSSYSRIRKEIHIKVRDELLSRPGRLFICGHSLGGAQGTLCAYDMARWVIPTVKRGLMAQGKADDAERVILCHYSYGSPRVGNHQFTRAYNKACRDTQRIVCDGDIIVANPPSWLGYRHVGRENDFDFTGNVRVKPSLIEQQFILQSRNKTNSHRLKSYAKVIKLAYQPGLSVLELLNLLREAYGVDKIVEESGTS